MDIEVQPISYILTTFLWSVATGLVLYHGFRKLLLFQQMPPGPYGLPFIGSILHLTRCNPIDEFHKYKQKYGKIFSVTIGDFYVIVINDYKIIQKALKKDEFTGRPDFELWHIRNFGVRNRGILFCDGGPVWQEQRRFTMRALKDFGFGKESMEGLLVHEMNILVKHLRKDIGKAMSLTGAFNASVLNSLWYIVTGKRYDLDDLEFKEAINLFMESMKASILASPGLFWPWPVKRNLIRRGSRDKGKLMRTKIRALINKHIEEHLEAYDYDENAGGDFLASYIQQMKSSGENSSFYSDEGKFNLQAVMLDLFVAGAETTSTTLLWAVLYLTQNPHVQSKIHAEIDSVIGKERPPTRDDKERLVYIEAVLNEVHRMCSLLPMNVFHQMLTDTEFEGYLLPKGSVVFLNLYDAHHDVDYWKDPEIFRPERFLDPTGTKLIKYDALMPFGYGKRQCLGELLARDTLFIFFTGLLQKFRFEIDPAMTTVDLKGTPTFVMSPQPYEVVISERL